MAYGRPEQGVALTTTAGGCGEIGLCCPICGYEYVHFDDCFDSDGEHTFKGECGHRWKIVFYFHKGGLFVTTEHLTDEPDEALDTSPEELAPTPRNALSKMLRWYIIEKFNYTCQYCQRRHVSSKVGPGSRPWHVDHVQPLSRGGVDGPENLTLSCERCNLRKHAKRPGEFRP